MLRVNSMFELNMNYNFYNLNIKHREKMLSLFHSNN